MQRAFQSQKTEQLSVLLSLYNYEQETLLSKDDYAWLSERGYIKTRGDYDKCFKTVWQVTVLKNKEIREKLLAMGEKIKEKYKGEFEAIKVPYVKAVLDCVPTHLRRVKEYELQFTFHSDGWFLLHCIVALLDSGKLKLPTEEQRKVLTTLILPNA